MAAQGLHMAIAPHDEWGSLDKISLRWTLPLTDDEKLLIKRCLLKPI
jgi:hypothetical protein